jgi:hypothetical protein
VGVSTSQRYDKYLGLQALVGSSRVREFQNLTDRVGNRVSNWKTNFLSQARKEILLKAVVQAISIYSMSIFLLSWELCKKMNRLMQKFWRGYKDNDHKIHWMSWEQLGKEKSK